MIETSQLKSLVISPALVRLSACGIALATDSAVNLTLGTIMHESTVGCAQCLKQIDGPALGIGQMEPATLNDEYGRWLHLPAQAGILAQLRIMMTAEPLDQQIISNLSFTACMVRLRYYPDPAPLPDANDAVSLALLYKRVYNTSLGAATVDDALVETFRAAINA